MHSEPGFVKINLLMEIECSKCQRKFHSAKEDEAVCPDCLRSEFAVKATSLDEKEHAELLLEYRASMKRQAARAEMMGGIYASGRAFSVAGTLRLALGIAIFLICGLLFIISDKKSGATFLAELDMDSQRLFSMILCVVAAVLVATSSIRFKAVARILGVAILAAGWYLPNILAASIREKARLDAEAAAKQKMEQNAEMKPVTTRSGKVLTDEDLQVFYTLRTPSNRINNYAVFIDNQDSRARGLVRDALNRLMEAEYTRAYTRANGALYVITNAPGERKNLSRLLSRLGTVTYAEPAKGIYEVRFDADRANLVSQYPSEVLTSPMNNAYVSANLSELRCLDPMRVRMSARSLAASNVAVLRGEIRDTLVEVLHEPWSTEPDTHTALIEALVTYCGKADKDAAKLCYDYFQARRASKREISMDVTHYLIREAPRAMVRPIVDMWCENPIAWDETLDMLGNRVQALLLVRLTKTNNIRLITSILKYLEKRGTPEALPAVESFLEYPDSIIRHSARMTQKAINGRSSIISK